MAAPAGQAGTGRTEAFSDGVLAIAITLLVLNLTAPAHRNGGLARALLDLWPSYLAFLSSFVYIGVIWLNHHAIFRHIHTVDRVLNWANLALLLGAVVLPFPTAVLSDALRRGNVADERTAVILYAAVAGFLAVTWYAFYGVLLHRQHLHRRGGTAELRLEQRRAIAGMVSYTLAAAIGVFVPLAALALFFLMPVFYAVTSDGVALRREG